MDNIGGAIPRPVRRDSYTHNRYREVTCLHGNNHETRSIIFLMFFSFFQIRDTEIRIAPITSTDSVERTPLEAEVTSSEATTMLLQETTENPYDIIDIPTPAMPIQTSDKVPYELLSGTNLMLGTFFGILIFNKNILLIHKRSSHSLSCSSNLP